jgi:ATP-binding cassette subfamily C (CFTR/MRP) protein 1
MVGDQLEGLVTIRAFGWKSNSIATNIKRLDVSQQPYYIMMCIQRWLNLVLDLLVAGIAVTIISLAVFFRGSTTGGQIGIALNIVLVFNSVLLRLVATWTRMETSLGAIARLKMLEETTICEDKPGEDFMPDDHWPSEGLIEFRQVTASYRSASTR